MESVAVAQSNFALTTDARQQAAARRSAPRLTAFMKSSDNRELNFETSLTAQLEETAADALARLNLELAAKNGLVTRLIDTQFRFEGEIAGPIAARHAMGYDCVSPNLLSIVHRNLIQCCVALRLNNQGFYGAAGCLLRSVYEGLIVSKYCSINDDNSLFNH